MCNCIKTVSHWLLSLHLCWLLYGSPEESRFQNTLPRRPTANCTELQDPGVKWVQLGVQRSSYGLDTHY